MDADDIDSWYEEQKQKLLDDYLAELEKGANHQEAEKKYNEKMDRLMAKYNSMMSKALSPKKKGSLGSFIQKIRDRIPYFGRK